MSELSGSRRRRAFGVGIVTIVIAGLIVSVSTTRISKPVNAASMSGAQYSTLALAEVNSTWNIHAVPADLAAAPPNTTILGKVVPLVNERSAQVAALAQSAGAKILNTSLVNVQNMAGGTHDTYLWAVDLDPSYPVYPASNGGLSAHPAKPMPDNYYVVFVDAYTGEVYMTITGQDGSLPTFSQLQTLASATNR